ncbi:MAG: hypothetical protein H7289_04130 [Mucilaginibacter sp.]|nr:hypothetical protein [Mucilaginibacter sp.]
MAQRLKRYSTSFKVIVLAGLALAAAYTVNLFTGTKQTIVAEPVIAETQPVKKHHKKHKLKNHLAIAKRPILKKDTVKDVTPQIVTVPKPEPVKAVVPNIVTVPKSAPVKQPIETNNGFLYITYIHPNVTGIVKMRQEDKFSSSFIADIPANAKVQVLQKGDMYYRVAYNNSIGFVPKWALQDK